MIGLIYERMNRRYRLQRKKKKCVMTITKNVDYLINSTYKLFDNHFKSKPTKHQVKNKRRKSRRYYIRCTRHKMARIGNKAFKKRASHAKRIMACPATTITSSQHQGFDSDSFPIGIDSHATKCISNDTRHFISTIDPSKNGSCNGFGGTKTRIHGEGTIKWKYLDDKGIPRTLIIKGALYVPEATLCLLSPQHADNSLRQSTGGKYSLKETTDSEGCVLTLHSPTGNHIKTILHHHRTNTPVFQSAPDNSTYNAYCIKCEEITNTRELETTAMPTEVIDSESEGIHTATGSKASELVEVMSNGNDVLTASTPEGELLRWHHRLGHLAWKKLKLLALLGVIPRRLAKIRSPPCACCIAANMSRLPTRSKGAGSVRTIHPATRPGQYVSVDQLECSTPGFVAQLKGRLTKKRYRVSTVYVDHKSDLTFIYNQESTTSTETLESKHAFEAFAREKGVDKIEHYHSDNGRFIDDAFRLDCEKQGQTQTCCGVNAHHQNGKVEKRIRDLCDDARKSLIHAIFKWNGAVITALWPYALRHAANVRNSIPDNKDGTCALERFTGAEVRPNLKWHHTFGCPVYALDNRLQQGQSIPRWEPRARLGIYLGESPRHARSVSLVLNTTTGLVSPQYHVKHDDFFETTNTAISNAASIWQTIAGFTNDQVKLPEPSEKPTFEKIANLPPIAPPPTVTEEPQQQPLLEDNLQQNRDQQVAPQEEPGYKRAPSAMPDPTFNRQQNPSNQHTMSTRRVRERSRKLKDYVSFSSYYEALHQEDYRLQDEMDDPIAFAAKDGEDTLHYGQAMRAEDRRDFIEAMVKEVEDHVRRKHWKIVHISEVPKGHKVLDAVWSFKRKRDIVTQRILKWKARLTIHGGQQQKGLNFWETYSPVVNWFSIRLILTLAIVNRWATRQVDFVLAFPQAPIECDLYMRLPVGFEFEHGDAKTHVLKLTKNLYGQKQAGKVWFDHLAKGLKDIGFKSSAIDECVFTRGSTLFMCYVDDGIFADPNQSNIDKAIEDLKVAGFDIENKGDLQDYLGIHVDYLEDGRIKLSQPHLINQIIKQVGLDGSRKTKRTPAANHILHRSENEEIFDDRFHYRSVVGKLNFLEKCTRPDISYATHQCARFSVDPRRSHGDAVEYLCKYLIGTKDKGLILDPDTNQSLNVFVDADFSGNYQRMTAIDDVSTAKSRTGYIVQYCNCPIIWLSKLQTLVTLSTTEAEYVALSQSLRDTFPIMNLLNELRDRSFPIIGEGKAKLMCKLFEDNSGAVELANVPKMRPRTKHINLVYHHFRSHVNTRSNPNGDVIIQHIETGDQIADIFTKPLAAPLFERHRKRILFF